MSTASNVQAESRDQKKKMMELTLRGCEAAREAATALGAALTSGDEASLATVKTREEELDVLDRDVNEGVTAAIANCSNPTDARELLACLKFIIELERIGDLFLSFANRLRSCASRLDQQDCKDLAAMATITERMLSGVVDAFTSRDPSQAAAVIRADAELDRLRNLTFVRHIENPEGDRRTESFHVVFMAQTLERAGDHAKNLAEEVVHLVTGRSVRHLLRSYDKPWENLFIDSMRKKSAEGR
jgi:phosphate transport system protein